MGVAQRSGTGPLHTPERGNQLHVVTVCPQPADVCSAVLCSLPLCAAGSTSAVVHSAPAYGSFRVSDASNVWSSRRAPAAAIDAVGGYLYSFGGETTAAGKMSDVGRFEIATNIWTWWAGAASSDPTTSYPSPLSDPAVTTNGLGAYAGCLWADPSGGVWYGFGYSSVNEMNEFWNVPTTTATLTFDLTPAPMATVNRAFVGLAVRPVTEGSNVVTLGVYDAMRSFTWTVRAEDGTPNTPFTLVVIADGLSADRSWTGTRTSPGEVGVAIDSTSISAGGTHVIQLPNSAVGSTASLSLSLAAGATISTDVGGVVSASLTPSLTLVEGSNLIRFTVSAESGLASGQYAFDFEVAAAEASSSGAAAAAAASSSTAATVTVPSGASSSSTGGAPSSPVVSSSSTGGSASTSSGPLGGGASSSTGVGCIPGLTCAASSQTGERGMLITALVAALTAAAAAAALAI